MSSLRFAAAQQLAIALGAQPALAGICKAEQAAPTERSEYPAVVVTPERMRLDLYPGSELEDADGDPLMAIAGEAAVVHVGALEGAVRLWAGARYPAKREQLEDAVLAAFTEDDAAPGRLLTELTDIVVGGVATAATWPVSFHLEADEWRDELVFSERRWSFISIAVDVPVFALRREAWIVNTLVLAMTHDLETDLTGAATPDEALALLDDVEQVQINDDGTLSEYP